MKKVIYTLTLLIGISMTIQAQNTSVATDSVINILEGEWLWTSSTGGFCGCTIKGDKSRKYVFKKHPTSTDSINYDYLINEKVQSSGASKVTYTSEKINNKSGWFLENLMNEKANILFSNSNK